MGEARYSNDMIGLDALALAIVGSPRPHIKIRRLDVSAALDVPGVLQVLTAHDIPGKNRLPGGEQPFLVEGTTRFYGEPIALVIAEHPEDAILGASQVHIEFDELPAYTTMKAALAEDAVPIVETEHGANIWMHLAQEQGDVDQAFAQSEQVLHKEFSTPSQAAALLEPTGIIARPSSDGGLHVEGSIEAPFAAQAAVANILDLPHHRIYVVQRTLGGSGGSKRELASQLSAYAALAAWLTGRPTRLVLSNQDALLLAGRRPSSVLRIKYGVTREGILQACEVDLEVQAGAYPAQVEMALRRAIAHATGPYHIPHIRVKATAIATHTVPVGLQMGYGQVATTFAQECLLDELAQRLNLDPVALRRKNLIRAKHPLPFRDIADSSNQLETVLDAVLQESGWLKKHKTPLQAQPTSKGSQEPPQEPEEPRPSKRKRRGLGLSVSFSGVTEGNESPFPPQATVSVRLQGDGSVQVSTAMAKTGRGLRTQLAQIAAEGLRIPYHSVHLLESDTLQTSSGPPYPMSPSLLVTGQALMNAIQPLAEQLKELAAAHFQCEVKDVQTPAGRFLGPQEQSLSFAQVVQLCQQAGAPTARYGYSSLPSPRGPHDHPQPSYPAYSYAAHVAEVEVDIETFEVEVLALYVACDCGTAINPDQASSDIEGQLIKGLGMALLEETIDGNGVPFHAIPTFRELPQLFSILLDSQFDQGPYGSKGLDSLPVIGVAPAILNAISQALGRRLYDIPATPERLFSTQSGQS